MEMPFGKYQGRKIEEIPYDYLVWLRTNVPLKSKNLKTAIEYRILDIEAEWQACEDLCIWDDEYVHFYFDT